MLTRTLTSAEILALLDTVEVVAGVPGKVLWPISACVLFHANGAGYSMTQSQKLILAIGPGVFPVLETTEARQVLADIDKFAILTSSLGIVDTPPIGESLTLGLTTENPTGADGGTLDLILHYVEVTP